MRQFTVTSRDEQNIIVTCTRCQLTERFETGWIEALKKADPMASLERLALEAAIEYHEEC